MIRRQEIVEKARKHGVPESTIERDYAQNWLIRSLSSLDMVMKGGTAIRKVYVEDYRFSDDLDFTLLSDIDADTLNTSVEQAVEVAAEDSGINFDSKTSFRQIDNGFEINVYFQLLQRGGNRTRIKIDITSYGDEPLLLPAKKKQIFHQYSDELRSEISVYSLDEIMAEKIRSLFQRTRPRDLCDVWFLGDRVDKEVVLDILPKKFRTKGVERSIRDLEGRKETFRSAWVKSLSHQLRPLPEFNEIFSAVVEELEEFT